MKTINSDPEIDVVYTDEDKLDIDGGELFEPHFKPDFNPDLLTSVNYICHLFVVNHELLMEVGGFREEYDGAQDYDFIFRCTEKPERSPIFPRLCITGAAIRIPLQAIRKVNYMLLRQGQGPFRPTMTGSA